MDQTNKKEVVMLNLDDIIPNKFQPREVFDDHALKELAVSIKEHGVIQPIIVREVNGKYEIIAGERRYKASALAGKTTIPAIVNNLDDKESSKVALLENLQRKDLNPIEEAKTYQKVLELDEMTQEELAKTMGKSQSAVANKLRLLQLNDDVKKALLSNEISERHARTLLRIDDSAKQTEMLKRVITEKINVRDLEKEIDKLYPKEEKQEELTPVNEVATPESSPIKEPSMDDKKAEPENFLNSFLNNSPLAPTTEIKDPDAGIGEVKIINDDDPTAEKQILNYANINDDEDEEDNSSHTFLDNTTPDVNDIKNNSQDINQTTDASNSSLDSLLNLPTPTVDPTQEEKFRSTAEEIIKTAETQDSEEDDKPDDYFKTPDLDAVKLPNEIETSEDSDEDEEITVDKAKEKIKNLIGDLRVKGLTIGMDEMDFPSTYQVILKIDKNQ